MTRKKRQKNKLKVFVGIIIIILALLFVFLYQFFGLKEYIKAMNLINSSSTADKKFANDMFYTYPKTEFGYSGILAYVNGDKTNFSGVWIWGLKGLKYFKGNTGVVFSNFKICNTQALDHINIKTGKNFNIGYGVWKDYVRVGDLVGVYLTPNTPSDLQKIQEVYSYDWWVFIKTMSPGYLESTCKNR